MRERPHRSDHYQWMIQEVCVTDKMLESYVNSQGISHLLNPYQYSEDYLNLKDQLKEEFWKVARQVCTERQWQVVKMYVDGYTQMEIAKELGVNQSSIVKSLRGNTDYKNGGKTYGGLIKKMKKAVENHQKINDILEKMDTLREEKW